jgi:hypothetical protein
MGLPCWGINKAQLSDLNSDNCYFFEKNSNPKSFVNFLLPDREFGEGWGGVKNLRLLQGLLYDAIDINQSNIIRV